MSGPQQFFFARFVDVFMKGVVSSCKWNYMQVFFAMETFFFLNYKNTISLLKSQHFIFYSTYMNNFSILYKLHKVCIVYSTFSIH